jgi:hypothetical protein
MEELSMKRKKADSLGIIGAILIGLLGGMAAIALLLLLSKPKCPHCHNDIEKGTPICPHCNIPLQWGR